MPMSGDEKGALPSGQSPQERDQDLLGNVSDASPPRRPRSDPNSPTAGDVSDASPPRRRHVNQAIRSAINDKDASSSQHGGPGRENAPAAGSAQNKPNSRERLAAGAVDFDGRHPHRKRQAPEKDEDIDVQVPRRSENVPSASGPLASASSRVSIEGGAGSSNGRKSTRNQHHSPEVILRSESDLQGNGSRPVAKKRKYSFNRYNIPAGPRWDGLDRSNGFEQRLDNAKEVRKQRDRQAYNMSVADL